MYHLNLYMYYLNLYMYHLNLYMYYLNLYMYHLNLYTYHLNLYIYHLNLYMQWRSQTFVMPGQWVGKPFPMQHTYTCPSSYGHQYNIFKMHYVSSYTTACKMTNRSERLASSGADPGSGKRGGTLLKKKLKSKKKKKKKGHNNNS